MARGQLDRIGGEAILTLEAVGRRPIKSTAPIPDHGAAVEHIIGWLTSDESGVPITRAGDIQAVGHRVVHGGERFRAFDAHRRPGAARPSRTRSISRPSTIRTTSGASPPRAPCSAPAFRRWPCSTPPSTRRCPSARTCTRSRISSTADTACAATAFTARRTATWPGATAKSPAGTREQTKIITLHLGNGCSVCAIDAGESVDTSMGFTPLEGLVMGTRSGDLDPAILDYVAGKEGLIAVRGRRDCSTSSRDCSACRGSPTTCANCSPRRASTTTAGRKLAIDLFCYRTRKYIGAYLAALDGADAIVFAGGIGEHAADVRAQICDGLDWLGVTLDDGEKRPRHCRRRDAHQRRGLTRRGVGHPHRRGTAHRPRHVACRHGRPVALLMRRSEESILDA